MNLRPLLIPLFALAFWASFLAPAYAVTVVPPGNRSATQPKIPGGSVKRSRGTTFEKKYQKIRNLLARDATLRGKIVKAARTFGIDPVHIAGALVGEHTYNVDAKDRLQSYYVKALAYLNQDLSFQYKGTSITDLTRQPRFQRCRGIPSNYDYWTCVEAVWDIYYRGKSVAGRRWPNDRLGRVFFQPFYAGQTFGLGQLNPLTALKVNDIVRARVPREPKLSVRNAPVIYNTIMEPDSTLYYMAAVLKNSIDLYRSIAGMDISQNPGITATLYNLGNVTARAAALAEKNQGKSRKTLPKENYYGWLVNDKIADLRAIFR
ncbi:MAG: DUF1402 family protein [Pseudomonadota bacterium]